MRRVVAIFTGGTISMRATDAGSVPVLSATDLLATVPGIEEIAEVEPVDWGIVAASHITFAQVLELGRLLADQLARPDVDGAVVVQGTDAIEETAFAWDLLPLGDKPVAVVGAMRTASQSGYDGPENLRNAVAAAASDELRGQGTVVVLAGEIHGADDVRKTHTHAIATFQSPNLGRMGVVADARVVVGRRRSPVRLPRIPTEAALPVPLVPVVLDAAAALPEPDPRAVVFAAAGGGNTPPGHLALARTLMADGVPVILTTRCPSGRPLPGYAFEGGSSQWWEAGALFSGTLDGLKARVLAALGLGAGLDRDDLAALVAAFGGGAADRP
jgi:L-asparaginase